MVDFYLLMVFAFSVSIAKLHA